MSRDAASEVAARACIEWGERRAGELIAEGPAAAGFRRIVALGYAIDDANHRAAQFECEPGDVAKAIHRLMCMEKS